MLTRITFNNYGTIEHMFFEETESEARKSWHRIWGTDSVSIISTGQAINTNDFGGYPPRHNLK